MKDLEVAYQAPAGLLDEARRHFAGDALDVEVGAEPFEDIDDEVKVFVEGPLEEAFGVLLGFGGHRRALDELQLVELDAVEREGIDQ